MTPADSFHHLSVTGNNGWPARSLSRDSHLADVDIAAAVLSTLEPPARLVDCQPLERVPLLLRRPTCFSCFSWQAKRELDGRACRPLIFISLLLGLFQHRLCVSLLRFSFETRISFLPERRTDAATFLPRSYGPPLSL